MFEEGNNKIEKGSVGKQVRNIYNFFVKYWIMAWFPLFLMVVCFSLDCCSYDYIPGLESFFKIEENDFTGLGCVIMVIWTFTTTLLVFYLGKAADKRYGIKVIDITRETYSDFKILCCAATFLLGLLSILGAVKHKWPITLSLHIWLQILWMLYVLVLICVEMSNTHIQELIKKDVMKKYKVGQISRFFIKMLNTIDYGDDLEVEKIYDILEETVKEISEKQFMAMEDFVAKCLEYMMKAANDKERVAVIIKKYWERKGDKYISVKRGMLVGVLDNIFKEKTPCLKSLVEMTFEDKRKIIIWGIIHNGFRDEFSDEMGTRGHISRILWKELGDYVDEAEEQEMFLQWEQLIECQMEPQEEGGLKDYGMVQMARVIFPEWRGEH